MKHLLIVLALAFATPFSLLAQKNKRVEVAFTTKQTKEKLMTLKQSLLKDYNIQLDFNEWEFDEKGKLKSLRFSVDCRDGFSGSVLGLGLVTKKKSWGFYRDYRQGVQSAFGVGNLKEQKKKDKKASE